MAGGRVPCSWCRTGAKEAVFYRRDQIKNIKGLQV